MGHHNIGYAARPRSGLSRRGAARLSAQVFWAFSVDACLYSVWQATLMPEEAPAKHRFVPFFGLAAYLMDTSSRGGSGSSSSS